MLRADELEPMKKKEPGWVPEEDDHDCDLQYWNFEVCPDRQHCKKDSWKRAACWSYVSEDQCRAYLVQHLMCSEHHQMPKSRAQELAHDAEIDFSFESRADRDQARADWAKSQEQQKKQPKQTSVEKRARSRTPQRGGNNGGGKGRIQALEQQVAVLQRHVQSGSSSSASGATMQASEALTQLAAPQTLAVRPRQTGS